MSGDSPLEVRPPRGVIFDLDNTLFDRARAVRALLGGWFDARALSRARLAPLLDVDDMGYTPRSEFLQAWSQLADELGCPAHPDELWDIWQRGVAQAAPEDPALLPFLRRVSARARVGVLTNGGRRTQLGKLRQLGLCDVLPPTRRLISEQLGRAKPHPDAFALAARALELPAACCLHVGDAAREDIWGARRAGMRTCWVALGRSWEQAAHAAGLAGMAPPDEVVEHYTQVEELLR